MFIDDFLAFSQQAAPEQAAPGPGALEPVPAGQESGPFGPISAEKVSFGYPGSERVALRDVSLRIEPGEVVALVAPTGRARPRWPNCWPDCTCRAVDAPAGTGLVRGTWTASSAAGTYAELFSLQALPYQ